VAAAPCSFVQAAAAAQAGASVIQPSVGRIETWYQQHPGVIRDPRGPREDSGYSSGINPAMLLVEKIYNYVKKYYPKTMVMASSIRSKQGIWFLRRQLW
jgi:transaldolase